MTLDSRPSMRRLSHRPPTATIFTPTITFNASTMDDEMYDGDADLIEQVSDDEEEDGAVNDGADEQMHEANPGKEASKKSTSNKRNGRFGDQVNFDDEPALQGYTR
jgi:hypothetical protein